MKDFDKPYQLSFSFDTKEDRMMDALLEAARILYKNPVPRKNRIVYTQEDCFSILNLFSGIEVLEELTPYER